jgi:hypothetical protein
VPIGKSRKRLYLQEMVTIPPLTPYTYVQSDAHLRHRIATFPWIWKGIEASSSGLHPVRDGRFAADPHRKMAPTIML